MKPLISKFLLVALAPIVSAASAATCESLASLSLPNTTILLAQSIAAGAFTPPPTPGRAGGGRGANFTDLPAFCRAQASDTAVNASVNAVNPDLNAFFDRGGKLLPIDGWNDNQVPPKVAVNYYKAVVAKVGAKK